VKPKTGYREMTPWAEDQTVIRWAVPGMRLLDRKSPGAVPARRKEGGEQPGKE